MAIERGKFQNLLFDDFDRLDHAVLRAVTRIVVGLPPVKKALLSRQVQSRFFRALAGKGRDTDGENGFSGTNRRNDEDR